MRFETKIEICGHYAKRFVDLAISLTVKGNQDNIQYVPHGYVGDRAWIFFFFFALRYNVGDLQITLARLVSSRAPRLLESVSRAGGELGERFRRFLRW